MRPPALGEVMAQAVEGWEGGRSSQQGAPRDL